MIKYPMCGGGGGGGLPRGLGHNLLMQFSRLSSSKMEISETDFFHTLTIQNDQISYVKHVLAPFLLVFSHYLAAMGGGGGGLPRGLGHNLLMQFSRLSSSKMEISETDFFHTLTIQNDQISYVRGGGGAPKGSRAQPADAVFPPQQLKNGNFRN